MERRRYLWLAAAGFGGLAGCAGSTGTDASTPAGDSTPADDGGVVQNPADVDLPVSREEMQRGAPKDAIPAIVDPVFDDDWSGVSLEVSQRGRRFEIEPRLGADDLVIGVERGGEARAYPLRILNWHEVVNDEFDGPLLVTYCPLCRSGVTGVRKAGGEVTTFGVSGLLWRNDLVMYDEATGSLWSQVIATAVNGELTGEEIEILPSTLTTWDEWRADHPGTVVLRPPPESSTVADGRGTRDYRRNPYDGYGDSTQIGIGGEFDDDRLHPKTEVIGVAHGDVARAYPADAIAREGVVNDSVDGLPVVVTTVEGSPVAYVRRVDGETVTFEAADERHLRGAGSRWRRTTGEAVDGPHEGRRLEQANDVSPLFWFAWLDFHPDSELYQA